jgi:hypothetical protein
MLVDLRSTVITRLDDSPPTRARGDEQRRSAAGSTWVASSAESALVEAAPTSFGGRVAALKPNRSIREQPRGAHQESPNQC